MSNTTSTNNSVQSTKPVLTDLPKSVSGVTGRVKDAAVKEKLDKIRAGAKGDCGGTAPGWAN